MLLACAVVSRPDLVRTGGFSPEYSGGVLGLGLVQPREPFAEIVLDRAVRAPVCSLRFDVGSRRDRVNPCGASTHR